MSTAPEDAAIELPQQIALLVHSIRTAIERLKAKTEVSQIPTNRSARVDELEKLYSWPDEATPLWLQPNCIGGDQKYRTKEWSTLPNEYTKIEEDAETFARKSVGLEHGRVDQAAVDAAKAELKKKLNEFWDKLESISSESDPTKILEMNLYAPRLGVLSIEHDITRGPADVEKHYHIGEGSGEEFTKLWISKQKQVGKASFEIDQDPPNDSPCAGQARI